MSDASSLQLPSDSIRGAVLAGSLIVGLFFGVAGAWAALSPLDGAVVGDGVVMVEGNRKAVEHLEGGIIKRILVHDGDVVRAGDVLVELDDERLQAQVELFTQQFIVAEATAARLGAELAGDETIDFAESDEGHIDVRAAAMASQRDEFVARREALAGAKQVLERRIGNLEQQIQGKRARITYLDGQRSSLDDERQSLEDLLGEGLTTRTRLLDLQRAVASTHADMAEAEADIAALAQTIEENRQQIMQLDNDRRAEIASRLNDIRSAMLDLGPNLANARDALLRTVVRSPYAGRVVGLRVFSTGAVIPPGGTILEVVPTENRLVVEAKVRVEDIADLKSGATAELHFVSHKQLYVPTIAGRVEDISADRLTDERTGFSYYVAKVVADPVDLANARDIELYPGMPAQVMIATRKRTALEYLLGPMVAAFDGSFRQN